MKIIGAGILTIFVGLALDSYYHSQVAADEPTRAIMFGHVPLIVGVLIVSYGALRGYRTSSGYRKKTLLVMTLVAAVGAFGRAFDDVFHLMDEHTTVYNTIGHTLWGIGFLGVILTLVALYVLPRWVSDSSEQAV